MEFIAHRINTILELEQLPSRFGAEVDLRDSKDGTVYLSHDPFGSGDSFEDYLKAYKHGTLILNIKSERIEFKVLELLNKYSISDYFFLDSSFPMIYNLTKDGERNIALRFSEFEGMETLRIMRDTVKWVWVDCFTQLPLDYATFIDIKSLNYKLCLVSPELQGREEDIENYKAYLESEKIEFDAICTKQHNIQRWL